MNQRITNLGSEIRNFGKHANLVTGNSAVVAFAAADLDPAKTYVLLQIQGQITRVSYDNQDPTASDGERRAVGDEILLPLKSALQMKFITESGAGNVWAQPCDLN